MNLSVADIEHLAKLKAALQEQGQAAKFEQLVAALIGRLLNVGVAVAKTGFQHGGDAGTSGREGRHLRIECKKYAGTTSLSDREVLGEVDQALNRDAGLEAWILAATRDVPEQLEQDLEQHATKLGVSIVVVDWKGNGMPALAVQLKEFRQRVDHIYTADTRERSQLQEQIVQLTSLNQTVSRRAEELTNALTISSKATGDWGEMILHKILEDSGLREGKEYSLQHTVEAEDESLQRPDAVIFLPEDRQVVVDSKVSNKAWKEYCAATDEETRAARLAEHLVSLRAHVRGLSARDYPRSPDLKTVDFVLMFVPVEAALLTAFAHDETLYTDAYRAKIILVVPSTLMAVLKLVEGMWLFQKRKESADKIADAGRKLFEKLTTFSDTFVEIGAAIEKVHGTFERARGQLATGKGNAIKLAQKMVELGVGPAPGKVMAPALAVLAESEDGEEDIEALTVLPAVDGASEIPGEAQG